MRIIAGVYKGVRLTAPAGEVARPTTDRVKESMFHLMGLGWHGGTAVDLFAGSGALGLEALSRGADRVVFVDRHPRAIAAIRENVARCGAGNQVSVWRLDWKTAWARVEEEVGEVGWVFVDPPYPLRLWVDVLQTIGTSRVRVTWGVVCEHPAREELPATAGRLQVWKTRTYGDIGVTLYVAPEPS